MILYTFNIGIGVQVDSIPEDGNLPTDDDEEDNFGLDLKMDELLLKEEGLIEEADKDDSIAEDDDEEEEDGDLRSV